MAPDKNAAVYFSHNRTEHTDPSLFERHCHNRCELLCVLSGRGQYIVEGARFPLLPRSLFLFRTGEYHYVCPDGDEPYERYVVNFHPDILFGGAAALPMLFPRGRKVSRGVYFPPERLPEEVPAAFALLEAAERQCSAGQLTRTEADDLCAATLTQILLFLSAAVPPEEEEQRPEGGSEVVADALSLLNDRLGERLTLSAVAAHCHVSPSYLCRVFRAVTGVTVQEYLCEKRMALARRLLAQGMPPTAVAFEVGYQDYSAFYRAFRQNTGRSPAAVAAEAPPRLSGTGRSS